MNETLKQRLLNINPLRPYVWRLKLTEEEYQQLGTYVLSIPGTINKEYAILAMIYIAEWYKRDYDGNVRNPLNGISAESLWQVSGFAANLYVYRSKNTLRHLESIYMLGGLPMRFILKRNDNKLLKMLCRLYKGEKSTLEDNHALGANQAVAFQESINNQASIYTFMKTLLESSETDIYPESELADKKSLTSMFITAVKTAYDEVMRDKFQLEWLIEYDPASPYMKRNLRVHLRSEEIGGFNNYLRFDRAAIWNIPDLMRQRRLRVSIRFKKGTDIIGSEEERKTILVFENTGQEDTGFEASSDNPWATLYDVPSSEFDSAEVVITDDNNKSYTVQRFKCNQEYMQLWKDAESFYTWSSRRNNQNMTAVVFTNHYEIEGAEVNTKPFFNKNYGLSTPWNFAFIDEYITLRHNDCEDIVLWNRDGYIQFNPRLYTDVLMYKEGKIRYAYYEDPETSDEPDTEELYPVIFRREDIKVFHFKTRDGINEMPEDVEIQNIEYKSISASNAEPYKEWTDKSQPPYGRIKLRLTIKGESKVYVVIFLPSMLQKGYDRPVVRDFNNNRIIYVDQSDNIIEVPVEVSEDYVKLSPSIEVSPLSDSNGRIILDVIQPTLIKEIYLDGKLTRYVHDGETFVLPYLLHERIEIHDFNINGYFEFKGMDLGKMQERGSLDKWLRGDTLQTGLLTTYVPKFLKISFGNKSKEGLDDNMMYWEYSLENPPKIVDANYEEQMSNYSILFQDMRNVREDLLCVPPTTHNDNAIDLGDWGAWDAFANTDSENQAIDEIPLACYDTALKYKTYFFIFNPLFNISEGDFITEICNPVIERNNGKLREEDVINLSRCATELGFDWNKLNNKIQLR